MLATIARSIGRIFAGRGPVPDPVPFGPRYRLTRTSLTLEAGPLAGTTLRLEQSISPAKADFALFESPAPADSDPVAHCHYDRDPDSGTETLWDIVVRPDFMNKGLAALLVRYSFRMLLASGRRHGARMRNLMKLSTEGHHTASPQPAPTGHQPLRVSMHNIGIGIIARELGFVPEPGIERLLAPGSVKSVQVLPADGAAPPGLLIRVGQLPGLLTAAILDPDTRRPHADPERYRSFVSPAQLLCDAMTGTAIIGNIDYVLPGSGINRFAARLADNRSELRAFVSALRRGRSN